MTDEIVMDFSDVEPMSYDLLPEGSFAAEVEESEKNVSSVKGSPQVALTFGLRQPGFEKRKAWYQMSLLPQSKGFLMADLILLGTHTLEELKAGNVKIDPRAFMGRKIGIVIKHVRSKGNTYANVVRLIPLDKVRGPNATPSTVDDTSGGKALESDDDLAALFEGS